MQAGARTSARLNQVQSVSASYPDNVNGVLSALLATAMFAMAAAMAKIAVNEFHVLQILFFRQVVVFLSCLPTIATTFPGSLKTAFPGLHAARLTGAFIALSCGIWAVSVLPLTKATTLGFAQVFFVALLARSLLGEHVGVHRIVAVIVGFVGVVIAMRPGVTGVFDPHALIPVAGALGAGVAIISVRKLSKTESTQTLLVYQSVFVGVLAAVPLIWLWKMPDLKWILFLLAMGAFATSGQWFGVRALRLGEASVVGNVQYMQLVYAAILGFFLFNEIPDLHTLSGAAVIIGSAVYLIHRESLAKNHRKSN